MSLLPCLKKKYRLYIRKDLCIRTWNLWELPFGSQKQSLCNLDMGSIGTRVFLDKLSICAK